MRAERSAAVVIRQFQSETEAIRSAPEPIRSRIAVLSMAAILVAALFASTVVQLDRVVPSTSGTIVPAEPPRLMQAFGDTIIKSIDVREGERVHAGQQLATLDPTFVAADVDQLRPKIASLRAQVARLEAEQVGKRPVFPSDLGAEFAPYLALQKSLFDQRAAEYAAQLKSLDEKVEQAKVTVDKLQDDAARHQEREQIAHQIEDMRTTLAQTGAGSRVSLLAATDQRLEMLRTLESAQSSLVQGQHMLAGATAERDAYVQNWQAQISQDLLSARNELVVTQAQYAKAARNRETVLLTAPEDSVVLSVSKLSVGTILQTGDVILTLASLQSPVEAEVHLSPRDIGYVRAGDPCTLKIDALDSINHDPIQGRIRWISEDVFLPDQESQGHEAFYKARVSIDDPHLTGDAAGLRLIPGMTLRADIHIGHRSVIEYMFSGLLRGIGEQMRTP